ncbi:MAG: MMPL family transporter [Thermoplasmatota archaeon]
MKIDVFDRFTRSIGRTVVSHPVKIIIFFAVLTILLLIPITRMDTSTSMSDFTPESRFVRGDEVLRNEFNTTEMITAVLDAGSGSILSREALSCMVEIENTIRMDDSISPYLIGYGDPVMSIADPIAAALGSISHRHVGIENASDQILQLAADTILEDPQYSKLVSDDLRYGVLIFKLRYDKTDRDDESVEVDINNRIEEMDLGDIEYFSFSALNHHMREDAISSLSVLLPVSIVMVILILAVGLRSIPKVVASLIGITSAVIMSFGMFSLLGLLFSQMMYFAPIVIIVLCIDYGIHLLFRDREFARSGEPPSLSMMKAVRFMGISITLSMITTALAFGSNGLSAIPAVTSFGIFLALGIVNSFLVMMFFVPSLVLFSGRFFGKGRSRVEKKGKERFTGRAARISRILVSAYWRAPWAFLVAAFLLAGSGLYFGLQIDRDMTPEDVTAKDSPIVRAVEVMEEEFPGLGGERCYVIVKGDMADPENLDALDISVNNIMGDPHVADVNGSVVSIVPYVKMVFAATEAPDPDMNGLPDSREILLPILKDLYDNGIEGQVPAGRIRALLSISDEGFDGTVIMVSAVNVSGPGGGVLLEGLENHMGPLEENADILYAGFLFERYDMLEQMIDGMTASTLLTAVLVTVIVIILFRSFRYGIITSSPIVLVIGWIMGVMALTGYRWNMVTVTITSMTVGVGIDYSIHLVERYRQERERYDIREAMCRAIATTGGSLFAAAATTFGGFFVMAFSDIGMYNAFGMLTSMMIIFAFLSSVLVLPPAILWTDRILMRKATADQDPP